MDHLCTHGKKLLRIKNPLIDLLALFIRSTRDDEILSTWELYSPKTQLDLLCLLVTNLTNTVHSSAQQASTYQLRG